jgi:CheY-like chemotaxis protein
MDKTKILIVDDREENLIALEKILDVFDVDIIRSYSGNEALVNLIEHKFALVLMDVQMPEMDGFETVQIMRKDKNLEDIPVIFISAIYREEVHHIKGIESGAVDFIIKPVIPELLLGKVNVFIKIYENRSRLELLNNELSLSRKELIKAQKIGKICNFKINLIDNSFNCSKEFYTIHHFPNDKSMDLEKYLETVHNDDKSIFSNIFDNSISDRGEIFYRIKTADNGIKWIKLFREIINNSDTNYIFGIMQDVTVEVNNEESLKWELNVNKTLANITRHLITSKMKLENISRYIINDINDLMKSEFCYLYELDRLKRSITYYQIDNTDFFTIQKDTYYEQKISRFSLFTGEVFHTNNFRDTNFFSEDLSFIENVLSVPVKYNDKIIGEIIIFNSELSFSELNIDVIKKIANLYAIAINSIREEEHRHKMELEARQSEKFRVIGQLVGGIAHDFNNVLGGIMSAAQLLCLPIRNLDEGGLKYVNIITKSTTRAAELISKLLRFENRAVVSLSEIDINKVLDDSLLLLRRTISKKVSITETRGAENRIINGSFTDLENIVLNLSINSSHSIENNGNIEIITANIYLDKDYCDTSSFDISPGEYLQIVVKDDGHGISSDDIDKIFEPFYTTKSVGKGSGLGLAVTYGTIQAHSGEILVQSELGSGTTFTIHLPTILEDKKVDIIIEKNSGILGTILFVDDEELNRIVGHDSLESLGFKVILACDGEEAVDVYKNNIGNIDLVIIDMIMPKMSGSEAFYKIKECNEKVKVIIISGSTWDEDELVLRNDGVVGFIQKPYSINDLSTAIMKVK